MAHVMRVKCPRCGHTWDDEQLTLVPPEPKITPYEILEIYRKHNKDSVLPQAERLVAGRVRKCIRRINAIPNFHEVIAKAVDISIKTPFLRGENSRGWRVSFDYLINNDVNALAIIEGKFESKATNRKKRPDSFSVRGVRKGKSLVLKVNNNEDN